MFPTQETAVKSDENKVEVNPVSTPHTILVRSIWNQIQSAFPDDFTSFSSIEAKFSVKLSREDILILKRFVENRPDVSPESVNEILSRFLFPSDIKDNETFELSSHHFLFALPFVLYFIYYKFGLILLTIMTVLCIASYEVYVKGVAKRHALISRLPSVPEHCLPYSQQSIMTKLSSYISFVNSQDDCVKYFELQMTPIFADLRPDRILFLVFQDFAESVASTAGGSLGRFFKSLNSYVPFIFAIPLTILFLYFLPALIRALFHKTKKPKKKRILSKPKAPLTLKQD
nr:Chloride channel CLIC 1 [Hymenolepis microstoma]